MFRKINPKISDQLNNYKKKKYRRKNDRDYVNKIKQVDQSDNGYDKNIVKYK